MRERPIEKFRPILEPLEEKRPLSASASAAPIADWNAGTQATVSPDSVKPNFGFLVYRITQPNQFNNHLTPPFGHVLVQNVRPVPGQEYNVLQVAVRNGTLQTFTASDGLSVKVSGQNYFTPILTGNETWKPVQDFIFYILTKKYYPLANQVTDGFVFDLGGAKSAAIPGPSGIFLRIKYNPATINKVLDWIVQFGPGAEGGAGVKYGMPDTALYQFVTAQTKRNDFGGYF
ncbi:MAG: hypothetical protein P4L84_23345 [Isosphaeraceae bacterium]|nr:hypothetical protein [Isosphaeraceae bacterium]